MVAADLSGEYRVTEVYKRQPHVLPGRFAANGRKKLQIPKKAAKNAEKFTN